MIKIKFTVGNEEHTANIRIKDIFATTTEHNNRVYLKYKRKSSLMWISNVTNLEEILQAINNQ